MREYAIYDVFTEERYAGNPLAVVFDADGLDDAAMQTIAREFNLSETIFLFSPQQPTQAASARIFTTSGELPFAGHPTVGGAVALVERQNDTSVPLDLVSTLGEVVGPVRCAVKLRPGAAGFAEFDLPKLSRKENILLDREKLVHALGLELDEIGFENHMPTVWNAGVPYSLIPVRDLGVMEKIDFDPRAWLSFAPLIGGLSVFAYVYTRGGVRHDAAFHTRMFCSDAGMIEDPATGSAAAAFSGAINHFDGLGDGNYSYIIEQGVEMGRPSYIRLGIDVAAGRITGARIGGKAVRVARGELY